MKQAKGLIMFLSLPGQDNLAQHELASILFIILVFSLEMTTHTHNKPSPCK